MLQSPDQAGPLLDVQLTVELAPLVGRLDNRHDKLVVDALQETELFVALNSTLVRQPRRREIEPAKLIEALRSFQRGPIEAAMNFLVHERPEVLVPWAKS
jgi:hypothetical protein